MKRLLVCLLMTLFGLGSALWAQDEFFFTEESAWTNDVEEFWNRIQDQRYRHVATLETDSSGGETLLTIVVATQPVVGQLVLIENRDHPHREVHEIRHVFGEYVILKDRLRFDYLKGSRLYQLSNRQ